MSSKACPQPAISERRRRCLPAAESQRRQTAHPLAPLCRRRPPGTCRAGLSRSLAVGRPASAMRMGRWSMPDSLNLCFQHMEAPAPRVLRSVNHVRILPCRIPAVVHHILEGRRGFYLMWRRFTLWKTILESAASQQLEILFGSRSVLETRMCSEVLRASAGFSFSGFTSLVLSTGGGIGPGQQGWGLCGQGLRRR